MWKSSNYVFAGNISGLCLSLESLMKIVKIQLGNMRLSLNDLD
jgi:hypothetical protein